MKDAVGAIWSVLHSQTLKQQEDLFLKMISTTQDKLDNKHTKEN